MPGTTPADYVSSLLIDLEKAEILLAEFSGGYSSRYLFAEEFQQDLVDRIGKLKNGQFEVLNEMLFWFAPTCAWDDFTGRDGMELGDRIYETLLSLRKEFITINLATVRSIEDLHETFQFELGFPDFYGRNWDAFWDAITALVEMPKNLRLTGWKHFRSQYPRDSDILNKIVNDFNIQFQQNKITLIE